MSIHWNMPVALVSISAAAKRPKLLWTSPYSTLRHPMSKEIPSRLASTGRRRVLLVGVLYSLPSLLFLTQMAVADPLSEHGQYTDSLVQGKIWSTAAPFVDEMYGTVKKYFDYVLDSSVTARKNDALKEDLGRFYFKKEQRIRIECESGRVNKGAVVVRRNDGKVRAMGGGFLKHLKMDLDIDSRMLILATGYNVLKTDFKSLIDDLKSRLTSESRVSSEVVSGKEWQSPVNILEVRKGDETTDRIFVGQSNHLPEEWDLYRNGQLFAVVRFRNFQGNVGLKDELFDI
jgi:outer membrane lipoprotein-sorting protein